MKRFSASTVIMVKCDDDDDDDDSKPPNNSYITLCLVTNVTIFEQQLNVNAEAINPNFQWDACDMWHIFYYAFQKSVTLSLTNWCYI